MCTKLWMRYQEIALNQGRSKTPELQCVRSVGLLVSVCDLCDTIWMLVVVLGLFDILIYDLVNRVCQVNSGKMKYFEHKLRKSLNLVGALSNTNLTVKIILVERGGQIPPTLLPNQTRFLLSKLKFTVILHNFKIKEKGKTSISKILSKAPPINIFQEAPVK